jgi:hypothetical protein
MMRFFMADPFTDAFQRRKGHNATVALVRVPLLRKSLN